MGIYQPIILKRLHPCVTFATNCRGVLDTSIICPLVQIFKSESPYRQRKAASIHEFVVLTSSIMDAAISDNMDSGLLAIFQ
ncbi:hypothetical protein MLD38_011354 [Melastoma candidum]|uniref:Uncharacterized protein n=1 Tax=Melastoma candidum TaxID=119954 RepID=A0ACB9R274_9MYRT|nr:hypothetical protein MLD38_011354 [Melastoma candidum]